MSYLRVTVAKWIIDLNSAQGDEVVRKVREEGIPLLRAQPGFVRHMGIASDAHTTVTVLEWETEEQGQAGSPKWVEWVRSSSFADKIDGPAQVYAGTTRGAS